MSVTAPKGFLAGGIASGIKASGDPDLAVVIAAGNDPVAAAGVFTSNLSTAPPVQLSRAHLKATGGRARAVILNSGNANAATGDKGRADAHEMARLVAAELTGDANTAHVLVCSTGLIGIPLPMDPIRTGIPKVVADASPDGAAEAARAIMTTDTVRKEVVVNGSGWTIGGMAKGAAMLAPNMATMLAVLTTDAGIDPAVLRGLLADAVDTSFNALSVDGCQSTNDTVLVLASGRAGDVEDEEEFGAALAQACRSLAEQMAGDAEGATKVVRITVRGAESVAEARQAARKVAESQLCKCSWYGKDPYWGRIVSELGSAGVAFDPDAVSVSYGGVTVAEKGVALAHDADVVRNHMEGRELDIVADLGLGGGSFTILTNDLTHAYVDENMGTS